MSWAEDFTRSKDRKLAAFLALCGLAAMVYIVINRGVPPTHPLGAMVLYALIIAPGWYVLGRLKRLLDSRRRTEVWFWSWRDWFLFRVALVLLRLVASLLLGLPAAVVCLVLALIPSRWTGRRAS